MADEINTTDAPVEAQDAGQPAPEQQGRGPRGGRGRGGPGGGGQNRGGYLFHGRVKALADAARESGLNF